jgi:hypothetical protein
VTLRQAADEWLRYEEHEAKVKRSTVMDYRTTADRLCRELGDRPPPRRRSCARRVRLAGLGADHEEL